MPFAGPTPDLAPTKEGVQAAYTKYPQKLVKSVAEKPGDGKKVTAVVMSYGAPPKPLAKNKFHQALNKALGVDLELIVVPFDQYTVKLSTMMGSGDIPDIISMNAGGYFLPNEAQFVLSQCADLTEHLSGDAIKSYPNLANIPTYAWEAVGRFKGKIAGIPIERPLPWTGLLANQGRLKQAGIWVPEVGGLDVEAFTKGMQQLTDKNKWAHGASNTGEFGWVSHAANHGAPNMWALKDGTFSHTLESDELKASLEQMNAWYKAGLYRDDALSIDGNTQTLDFQNGTTSIVSNSGAALKPVALAVKDGFTVDLARPYKPGNGASPKHWFGNGYFSYTVLNPRTGCARTDDRRGETRRQRRDGLRQRHTAAPTGLPRRRDRPGRGGRRVRRRLPGRTPGRRGSQGLPGHSSLGGRTAVHRARRLGGNAHARHSTPGSRGAPRTYCADKADTWKPTA